MRVAAASLSAGNPITVDMTVTDGVSVISNQMGPKPNTLHGSRRDRPHKSPNGPFQTFHPLISFSRPVCAFRAGDSHRNGVSIELMFFLLIQAFHTAARFVSAVSAFFTDKPLSTSILRTLNSIHPVSIQS